MALFLAFFIAALSAIYMVTPLMNVIFTAKRGVTATL
jgi:hypothetical protein